MKTMHYRVNVDQKDILDNLIKYSEMFKTKPDRWEVVNYCIGYYGAVTAEHIEVINYLARNGHIV